MAKKVVISGYYGFKNFGDEAILSFLINILKSSMTDITVISSNPDYTKSIHNVNCIRTFDFKSIISCIKSSDVLISGGGSLLQDVTSLKSLIYYLLVISFAQLFRKKVIIFAQGIGPINNAFGRFVTRNILKKCHYISVRDGKSFELLKSWGINSEIVSDPVFSLPVNIAEKTKVVGVQLRNCRDMNDEFLKRLAKSVCDEFRGYNIKLLSLQDAIDLDICNRFKQIISECNNEFNISICSNLNHNDVIDQINSCEYLIGMRFHAIITALITGVKVLAINYDIKVSNIAEEFELPVIEINKEFGEEFNCLKSQDISLIKQKIAGKMFNTDRLISVVNE